jgi:hypothetical protein
MGKDYQGADMISPLFLCANLRVLGVFVVDFAELRNLPRRRHRAHEGCTEKSRAYRLLQRLLTTTLTPVFGLSDIAG